MALSTYQWQPPDTSWVGNLVMAGARMRQMEEARREQAAAQLAEQQQRQANLEKQHQFEQDSAMRLADQFKVQHAFKTGQAKIDNARTAQKDAWELEDRQPFPGAPELPAGTAVPAPVSPSASIVGAASAAPEIPAGPTPDIAAAPGGPEFVGPVQPAATSAAKVAQIAEEVPMTGAGPLPTPSLLPLPPDKAIESVAQAMRKYKVPSGAARKELAQTASTLAINAARPSTVIGRAGAEQMSEGVDPDGVPFRVMRTAGGLFKIREDGKSEKVGGAPRALRALIDGQGRMVQEMTDGTFRIDGVPSDIPPEGLTRVGGLTEQQRADTQAEEIKRRAEASKTKIQVTAEKEARDLARKEIDRYLDEAKRASDELTALRKTESRPRIDGGKFYDAKNKVVTEERFNQLREEYDSNGAMQRAAEARRAAAEEKANTAQKRLDSMPVGINPDKPAVPAPVGMPAPIVAPLVTAPAAPTLKPIDATVRAEMEAALKRNVPRASILKRLQEKGYDVTGL